MVMSILSPRNSSHQFWVTHFGDLRSQLCPRTLGGLNHAFHKRNLLMTFSRNGFHQSASFRHVYWSRLLLHHGPPRIQSHRVGFSKSGKPLGFIELNESIAGGRLPPPVPKGFDNSTWTTVINCSPKKIHP